MSSWMIQLRAGSFILLDGILATIAPAASPSRIRHNHPTEHGTSASDNVVYTPYTDN